MPKAIDKEALESPSMTMLDIGNPPTKNIPYQEYPKMIFLHPKDKSKDHRTRIVEDAEELASAEAKGWKTKPHIPIEPEEDLSVDFEAEVPMRRGRPPNAPQQ